MNSIPKGKKEFSSTELLKIRALIQRKCNASREEQKVIRDEMRRMGFFTKDFAEKITSVKEFDKLIKDGKVPCTDGQYAVLVKNRKEVIDSVDNSNIINIKKGLSAIVGEEPRILILGSLPGDESIQKQEYYSQKGNRFWDIIFGIFGDESVPLESVALEYDGKIEFLKENGIALWDVLSSGVRDGSMDVNISQESPNDIKSFLTKYSTIEIIGLNGKTAEEKFRKYFPGLISKNMPKVITLLSSSGANCQYSLSQLKEDWKKKLDL
ncbi:MAG: DNA-deoxyinosine glycosylase [Muribaculaceae bacterium]|nr:DNA-deoxyinosine glycosylase [Muribaculaceae bacterium]